MVFVAKAAETFLADANRDTVQAAHDAAANGDILVLPVGEFWWTNKFQWTKPLTIRGQGTNINNPATSTVLRENLPAGVSGTANQSLIVMESGLNAGLIYRLTNVGIRSGTNRTSEYFAGTIQLNGQSKAIIMDNLHMYIDYNRGFQVNDGAYGVVCRMTFDAGDSIQYAFIEHGSVDSDASIFGDRSWALAPDYGTTNAMYFENINNISHAADAIDICDAQRGGRLVIRYSNTGHIVTHGAEVVGNRVRGTRLFEFYMNTIVGIPAQNNLHELRSGSGVVWSNNFFGGTYPINLTAYRAHNQPFFWGGLNGQSGWDVNRAGGPFITGTNTAASPSNEFLTDSSQTWTNNALIGYSITNRTTGAYAMILTNSATTARYGIGNTAMWFTNGHTYSIWGATNGLDIIGLGQSDYNTDATPKWLNFAAEGVYQWANEWDGGTVNFRADEYPILREGYHYFNSAKPGYTPLIYPHPLVTAFVVEPVSPSPGSPGSPTLLQAQRRRRL